MLVRYWMAESPITVTPNTSLNVLLDLTHEHKVRRFPVLNEGELCGIVTISDLYRIVSPKAVRAAILPDKYRERLEKHYVFQLMAKKIATCSINDHIEDVAYVMRKKKIGALPVLKNNKLTGIITESDILDAFVKIAAAGKDSKRISLTFPLKEKTKEFYQIVDLCHKYSVDILTLLTHPSEDNTMILMTLRIGGRNASQLVDALWKSHHQILTVE